MFGRCPAVIRGLAGSRKFLFGSRLRTITGRSSDGLRSASERCHLCKLHARIFFTGVVRYRKNCKNHRCAPDYPLSPDTGRSLWPKHKCDNLIVCKTDIVKYGGLAVWNAPTYRHTVSPPLRKQAYSNTLQILPPKKWKFSDKNSDIFHISAQNIDYGNSLEPHRRGGSNDYPQSMFLRRNKKNNVYPSKPQFYYINVGFKGVKII